MFDFWDTKCQVVRYISSDAFLLTWVSRLKTSLDRSPPPWMRASPWSSGRPAPDTGSPRSCSPRSDRRGPWPGTCGSCLELSTNLREVSQCLDCLERTPTRAEAFTIIIYLNNLDYDLLSLRTSVINKEKALFGSFSGHSETLRRLVDSSIPVYKLLRRMNLPPEYLLQLLLGVGLVLSPIPRTLAISAAAA